MTIIFVYECSSTSKSDYHYVYRLISKLYRERPFVFRNIFSGGKARLLSQDSKIKNIKESLDGKTQVIMVADYDRDEPLNERIRSHCQKHGYELAWMNLDIEDVFLLHQISSSEKVREAKAFLGSNVQWEPLLERLRVEDPLKMRHSSNLLLVLDRYLSRK